MADPTILQARSVLTMDPALPRATHVAIAADGTIAAVGDLAACQAALPGAAVRDLGDTVLMPGFIDSHSHPLMSGMGTQPPTYWIAPYAGYPTWESVEALMRKEHAAQPAGQWFLFNGFDKLLHGAEAPDAKTLDAIFGDRPVAVADNSGHGAYFNTALMKALGWDVNPPADPPAGSFGRNPDGSLNGIAYELPAIMAVVAPVMKQAVPHPLLSVASWYRLMASNGITATTDHTFQTATLISYEAICAAPSCPLRVALYHMSTEADCNDPVPTRNPAMLWKQGVKLWADGSPWVGNIGLSYPYLDSEPVRQAGIPLDTGGEKSMNYSRTQLDQVIDKVAPAGWQLAFHVNGDVALDVVLDAYERGLTVHGKVGTDHRWRLEHVGAGRDDQFRRAGGLGLVASLSPFQMLYWGDLLDGTMFPSEIGSQWVAFRGALEGGTRPSFHNDGSVSPPIPLLNVQVAVTRASITGKVHGSGQAIPLDDALRGETVNAAFAIGRDHDLGSITPGKQADLVELSKDPYEVDPMRLSKDIEVRGTWVSGSRIDLDAFVAAIEATDAALHAHLHDQEHHRC